MSAETRELLKSMYTWETLPYRSIYGDYRQPSALVCRSTIDELIDRYRFEWCNMTSVLQSPWLRIRHVIKMLLRDSCALSGNPLINVKNVPLCIGTNLLNGDPYVRAELEVLGGNRRKELIQCVAAIDSFVSVKSLRKIIMEYAFESCIPKPIQFGDWLLKFKMSKSYA